MKELKWLKDGSKVILLKVTLSLVEHLDVEETLMLKVSSSGLYHTYPLLIMMKEGLPKLY